MPRDVIGVDQFLPTQWNEEIQKSVRVRCANDELTAFGTNGEHRAQEGSWRIKMFDYFAGDDDVGRSQTKG